MFMASNQFKVIKGREEAFENAWVDTSVRLRNAAGLIGFRFHKGTELAEHVVYFSITMWEASGGVFSRLETRRIIRCLP
jgi:heme-degrading monooxygenase HmoA